MFWSHHFCLQTIWTEFFPFQIESWLQFCHAQRSTDDLRLNVEEFLKATKPFSQRKDIWDFAVIHLHWEVVERILFLYAKLNPGQGYVQGMNELIGPIYYVFASDPREDWRANAEADCFFCFTNLMSDIRDFFIKTLDESETGINRIMHDLMSKLKGIDLAVYARIVEQDIKPQFYLFRWLTLMLTQEFALPEVLRIWDSLLTDSSRKNFLTAVCVSMMLLVREEILVNEFSDNMKLLQVWTR